MKLRADHINFLKQHYSNVSSLKLSVVLGINLPTLYQRAHRLGLKSSNNGKFTKGIQNQKTQFKPGHLPFNKGKKITEFMRPNTLKMFKQKTFKKGHKPHNTLSDGVITVRKDKRGIQYQFIRIDKSKWLHYHRYVWQQVNGEIPKNMIVVFKSPDTLNCKIENLQLISKADNVKRNSIHNYPEEMKDIFKLLGKIKRKINQKN